MVVEAAVEGGAAPTAGSVCAAAGGSGAVPDATPADSSPANPPTPPAEE